MVAATKNAVTRRGAGAVGGRDAGPNKVLTASRNTQLGLRRDARLRRKTAKDTKLLIPDAQSRPNAIDAVHPIRAIDSRTLGIDRETYLRQSLPKLFIFSGYVVGSALAFIFALDLLFAMPFSRVSWVFDVGFVFCGAVLVYLSWNAREGCY
jgi:hypothetical protein